MRISKTQFKDYTKCECFAALDEVYYKKERASQDIEEIKNLLHKMFSDDGNDEIRVTDQQLELLMGYYKEVERLALREASIILNKKIEYYEQNNEQMRISFHDKNGHQLYTYLDGYYEDDEEIVIVEVKATTSKKFLKLGPVQQGTVNKVFEKKNGILTVKEDIYNDEKMMIHYNKLLDKHHTIGKYIYDVAISNYIMNGFRMENYRLFHKKVSYYLAVLNSDYVYDGKSDYETNTKSIIQLVDVTKICNDFQNKIDEEYKLLIKYLNEKNTKSKIKKDCVSCIYQSVCHPILNEKNNVKTLLSPKSVKINDCKMDWVDLINNGYLRITDIPLEYLKNKKHKVQYECIVNENEYLDIEKIKDEIQKIKYPVYHLDFESLNLPLPRFIGEKPYAQSLFQFSIHIQKEPYKCDKIKDNYYFLPYDFNDCREELIKKMIEIIDLSKGGTVLVYNESFEKNRIKELIEIFPQYKTELENINNHIYDLMNVVSAEKDEMKYYNYKMNGSYSIKKLLPIYSNTSYSDFDVKNGIDAQTSYLLFKTLPREDIELERKKLLIYCGQDTYSMVEILDGIKKKTEL